jgi:hypothetical protein
VRPSLIIPRLRSGCPIFSNRVAGAASLKHALMQDDFPVPHAFVVRAPLEVGDPMLSDLEQDVTLGFAVAIAVSNTSDERGQDASEAMADCIAEVVAAIKGWTPNGALFAPILLAGETGDYTDWTRARAWTQLDFTSASTTAAL